MYKYSSSEVSLFRQVSEKEQMDVGGKHHFRK